jgi:hypothetical protein
MSTRIFTTKARRHQAKREKALRVFVVISVFAGIDFAPRGFQNGGSFQLRHFALKIPMKCAGVWLPERTRTLFSP